MEHSLCGKRGSAVNISEDIEEGSPSLKQQILGDSEPMRIRPLPLTQNKQSKTGFLGSILKKIKGKASQKLWKPNFSPASWQSPRLTSFSRNFLSVSAENLNDDDEENQFSTVGRNRRQGSKRAKHVTSPTALPPKAKGTTRSVDCLADGKLYEDSVHFSTFGKQPGSPERPVLTPRHEVSLLNELQRCKQLKHQGDDPNESLGPAPPPRNTSLPVDVSSPTVSHTVVAYDSPIYAEACDVIARPNEPTSTPEPCNMQKYYQDVSRTNQSSQIYAEPGFTESPIYSEPLKLCNPNFPNTNLLNDAGKRDVFKVTCSDNIFGRNSSADQNVTSTVTDSALTADEPHLNITEQGEDLEPPVLRQSDNHVEGNQEKYRSDHTNSSASHYDTPRTSAHVSDTSTHIYDTPRSSVSTVPHIHDTPRSSVCSSKSNSLVSEMSKPNDSTSQNLVDQGDSQAEFSTTAPSVAESTVEHPDSDTRVLISRPRPRPPLRSLRKISESARPTVPSDCEDRQSADSDIVHDGKISTGQPVPAPRTFKAVRVIVEPRDNSPVASCMETFV